jgi:hypothetical protein
VQVLPQLITNDDVVAALPWLPSTQLIINLHFENALGMLSGCTSASAWFMRGADSYHDTTRSPALIMKHCPFC